MKGIYGSQDPRDIGNYGFSEAARFLKLPPSTVRAWVKGQWYATKEGRGFFKPIIERPVPDENLLSFTNLVELHVLSAIRRNHAVSMPKVRQALDYIDARFSVPHPLAQVEFQTDGLDLFVEKYGQLLAVSSGGQVALRELLDAHLRRIERDEAGLARRLFPFTRPEGADQPMSVVIDPRISFGRPVLSGTGVPTSVIAQRYAAGESAQDLAEDYGCGPEDVEEAIRVEYRLAA